MAAFGFDEPFTTADSLNLQRLNQQLAGLSQQVSEGELYPQEAEPEQQALVQERNGLIQRQRQAQVAAQGQQRLQQQDEMAFQHAANLTNMQQAANQFMTTMPRFEDPDTGETTYFYPDGKGGFTPLERGGPSIDETDMGDLSGAVEDRVGPPEPPTAPMPPMPPPAGDPPRGGFEQTIQNGPYQTQVQYDEQGRTIDVRGSVRGAISFRGMENLDPRVAQEAWDRANAAVPGPPSAQRFERVQREFMRQVPEVQQQHQEQQAATVWGLSAQQFRFAQAQAAQAVAGMHPRLAQREYPRILNQALRTVSANQRAHSAELAKEQRAQALKQAQADAEARKLDQRLPPGTLGRFAHDAGMSVSELNTMVKAEAADIAASTDEVPRDFNWAGTIYSPSGPGGAPAKWKDMPEGARLAEARRRIQERLGLGQQPAGGQGGAPAQAPPGVQGGPPAAGAAPGGVQPAGPKAPVPQGTPAPPAGINFPKQPLEAMIAELQRQVQAEQAPQKRAGQAARESAYEENRSSRRR